MKKKILFISQVYPYPTDGGGKIKTYRTIQLLAKKYEIYAIFISEYKPSIKEVQHLKKMGVSYVKIFYNPHILDSVKENLLHLAWNFIRLRPHYVFQYTYKKAFKFIAETIKTYKPNIIHIDHINIAQYLPKRKDQIWILEHHNIEFYLLWTRFIHSSRISRKLYLLIECVLTFIFERHALPLFDHIFAISDDEKKRIIDFFKIHPKKISTQPLVYPLKKVKRTNSSVTSLLFVGNLGWPPNEDAIEWFLSAMWERIIKHYPNIQLHIVGKRNLPWESKVTPLIRIKNVFMHGYKKDIKSYFLENSIFILPFRMGGGVRIKSLTALSYVMPIVSTKLGVEGLKLTSGREYLAASSPQDFAEKVISLIRSKELRSRMTLNQKVYMMKYHSLDKGIEYLNKYDEIVNKL